MCIHLSDSYFGSYFPRCLATLIVSTKLPHLSITTCMMYGLKWRTVYALISAYTVRHSRPYIIHVVIDKCGNLVLILVRIWQQVQCTKDHSLIEFGSRIIMSIYLCFYPDINAFPSIFFPFIPKKTHFLTKYTLKIKVVSVWGTDK